MSTSNALTPPDSSAVNGQCVQFHQQFGDLFNNEEFSDLVLIVGEKRFAVHKAILTTRSKYFRTLFTSNFVQSNEKVITIQEAELFEKILRYLYSNEIDIKSESSLEELLETFKMASKYLVLDLQTTLENQLISKLSAENVCSIYSTAFECSSANLKKACFRVFYPKPKEFLQVYEFSSLHVKAVEEVISYAFSIFCQMDIFRAVSKWSMANGKANIGMLLSKIRLSGMPSNFLATTVRESGLYSDALILDAIAARKAIQVTVAIPQVGDWPDIVLNDINPFGTIETIFDKVKFRLSLISSEVAKMRFVLLHKHTHCFPTDTLERRGIIYGSRLEIVFPLGGSKYW